MRMLAQLAFIIGVASIAVGLASRPTIADGRVMAADLMAELRPHGVTGLACDRQIPIDRHGATFTCTAMLDDGATQTIDYEMDRAGQLTARLVSSTGKAHARIPMSADPWAN